MDQDKNTSSPRVFQFRLASRVPQLIFFDTSGGATTLARSSAFTTDELESGFVMIASTESDMVRMYTRAGSGAAAINAQGYPGSALRALDLSTTLTLFNANAGTEQVYQGDIHLAAMFTPAIDRTAALQLLHAPMDLLRSTPRRTNHVVQPSGGSADITEPADSLGATAGVVVSAALSVSAPLDFAEGNASVDVTAASSTPDAVDALAGDAAVLVERFGVAAPVEPVDILGSTALVEKFGVATIDEPDASLEGTAALVVSAVLVSTDQVDAVEGAGGLAVFAALDTAEPAPVFDADAFNGPGTISELAADDELSSAGGVAGVLVQAEGVIAPSAETGDATAAVSVTAVGAAVPPTDTTATGAEVLVAAASGAAEPEDTSSASARVLVQATGAATPSTDTTLTSIYTEVKARAVVIEPAESVSADGVMTVTAALAALEPGETLSSQIIMPVAAVLAVMEPLPVLGDADATVAIFSRVLDVVTDARVRLSDIDLYFD